MARRPSPETAETILPPEMRPADALRLTGGPDGECCGDCRFYRAFEGRAALGAGVCRRYPPVLLVGAGQQRPAMPDTGWCGEFEAAERDAAA